MIINLNVLNELIKNGLILEINLFYDESIHIVFKYKSDLTTSTFIGYLKDLYHFHYYNDLVSFLKKENSLNLRIVIEFLSYFEQSLLRFSAFKNDLDFRYFVSNKRYDIEQFESLYEVKKFLDSCVVVKQQDQLNTIYE